MLRILTANKYSIKHNRHFLVGYARETLAGTWYVFAVNPDGTIRNHEPEVTLDEQTARRKLAFTHPQALIHCTRQ